VRELDQALQIPGVSNAWTMPIKARTSMLTTGMRTAVGLKDHRPESADDRRHRFADRSRAATRAGYAERLRRAEQRGYFLDIDWRGGARPLRAEHR